MFPLSLNVEIGIKLFHIPAQKFLIVSSFGYCKSRNINTHAYKISNFFSGMSYLAIIIINLVFRIPQFFFLRLFLFLGKGRYTESRRDRQKDLLSVG